MKADYVEEFISNNSKEGTTIELGVETIAVVDPKAVKSLMEMLYHAEENKIILRQKNYVLDPYIAKSNIKNPSKEEVKDPEKYHPKLY